MMTIVSRGKPRRWVDLTHTLAPGRLEQFEGSRQEAVATATTAAAVSDSETAR